MQHIIFSKEPRIGDMFGDRNRWQVSFVQHHGGTAKYTLVCFDRFTQGYYERKYSAEVR